MGRRKPNAPLLTSVFTRARYDRFGLRSYSAMQPLRASLPTLHIPGFAHYSVAWSPYHNGRLAIASAANFGLVGNGRLHLATAPPGLPGLNLDKQYAIL